MSELTARQAAVYDYIVKCQGDGYTPTRREIGRKFGIKSTNGVADHIIALENKGFIRRGPKGQARRIKITGKKS